MARTTSRPPTTAAPRRTTAGRRTTAAARAHGGLAHDGGGEGGLQFDSGKCPVFTDNASVLRLPGAGRAAASRSRTP